MRAADGGRLTLTESERFGMGIFFDVVRSDPAAVKSLPGSYRKEDDSDVRCEWCGRWFTRTGYIPHKRNCRIRDDAELEFCEETGAIEVMVCRECGERLTYGFGRVSAEGRGHSEGCTLSHSNQPDVTSDVTPAEAIERLEMKG